MHQTYANKQCTTLGWILVSIIFIKQNNLSNANRLQSMLSYLA